MLAPKEPPRTIPGITPALRRQLCRFYETATRISPRMAARLALTLFVVPGRTLPFAQDRQVLAKAKRYRLPFDSGFLQVYDWDAPGPTVLLLHGWSSHASRLASFVDPLRRAGFRALAFDAPGHGFSSGLRSDLNTYRAAIESVLERTGGAQGIIAHSFGARATLRLMAAQAHPQVRALTLIGMPPDVRYMFEQFKLVLELRPDVQELLHEEFVRTFGAPPERHSPEEHAARVNVPVLLVHDEEDDVAPIEHAERLVRQLPRGELRITRGLNHCGPLRDPATINAVVEFISGQNAPRRPARLSAQPALPSTRPPVSVLPDPSAPAYAASAASRAPSCAHPFT